MKNVDATARFSFDRCHRSLGKFDTRWLVIAVRYSVLDICCFVFLFLRIKQSFFVTVAIFSLDQAGQRFSIIPEIPFWQSATFAITAALLFQKYQVSESK